MLRSRSGCRGWRSHRNSDLGHRPRYLSVCANSFADMTYTKRLYPAPDTPIPALMTINEAAALTELCDRTIRRRIKDGKLKAHRLGPRVIRIERESFLAWLNSPLDAA